MLMYGLSLSPTRAHFQKTPVILAMWLAGSRTLLYLLQSISFPYPFLFLSRMPGVKWWTYVLVQMSSRMTRRRDWKLNSADCEGD